MEYKLDTLDSKEKYRLLTNCIVPRPIAWVTSIGEDGIMNAAPFSFFTGISIEPPLVVFAAERRHGAKKDTVVNIEATKEFVINLVTTENVEKMNLTSMDYAIDENEIDLAGLATKPSKSVKPLSIAESPLHLECKLDQIIEIGSSPHSLIIGEVITVTADERLIINDRIDMNSLQAVGRMGGKWYTKTSDLFELPRLDWRKFINS